MQENELLIKTTNFGIACRIGDQIFVNKHLKEEPRLYEAIIQHEKDHTSGFSMKDVKMDLRNHHLKGLKLLYWRWVCTNPRSLIEFLPIWRYEGRFVVNPLNLGVYGAIAAILGGIMWLIV